MNDLIVKLLWYDTVKYRHNYSFVLIALNQIVKKNTTTTTKNIKTFILLNYSFNGLFFFDYKFQYNLILLNQV
ncbi:unnamed protein product [Schistosoma rodhaini]|uniref:Uncharacterized protein n=1 Tax=Schistosoma rodhaini TaxID=6188 RepID=A0AA85ERX3_9TREM|nr:unnamed protein product [Schistosoma rodhaini]